MTTNPRNIKWPQDSTGFLYGLKSAGIKAVERQMGNPEKHEALMLTLKELFAHAKARYELQASIRAERITAAAAEGEPQGELDLIVSADTVEPDQRDPDPADEAGEGVTDQTEKPADDQSA